MWIYIGVFLIFGICCLVLVWLFSFNDAEKRRCAMCNSENTEITMSPLYYDYHTVLKCRDCGYEERLMFFKWF
jgi:hypothetical protein